MSLLQYLDMFCLLYLFQESEVIARKSSLKYVFLEISQISQENILVGSIFHKAASWRPATSESGRGTFL